MLHETLDTLSSLIDGELPPADAERARAHAVACAECGAALARLQEASAAFKRSGEHALPAALGARAKVQAAPRKTSPFKLVLAMACGAFLLLVSGLVTKKFMPTLFNNIQQMITGAAGQMGSGGGK
ncbi:MAG: zf-HC2 domain-containing protein [Elusimicrobiota bacterium]|nr:zf-HC2 domain-containing protein [Elusimicrobiota bacterium]